MSRTQISTTVSERTRAQADWLVDECGFTLREAVSEGLRLLYEQEQARRNPPKCETCGEPLSYYPGRAAWIYSCDC